MEIGELQTFTPASQDGEDLSIINQDVHPFIVSFAISEVTSVRMRCCAVLNKASAERQETPKKVML